MATSRALSRGLLKSPRLLSFVIIVHLVFLFCIIFNHESEHHKSFKEFRQSHWDLSHIGSKEYSIEIASYEKKDWHDYSFMQYEATRVGPGEQGEGLKLTDPKDILEDARLAAEDGLHVFTSDRISVNRSIIDTRPIE